MAANRKSAQSVANLFGKRLVNQIWIAPPPPPPPPTLTPLVSSATLRRAAHTSVYDKNLDDQVRPSVVPDEIIQPQSDKYWAPHPRTGVFGPAATEQIPASGEEPASSIGAQDSVLEEKAWFRLTGLEDMEKPHHT